jgi:hypothetical protein
MAVGMFYRASRVKARSDPVTVVDEEALAKGPFIAQTVAVTLERNYIVVEL